ncbi:DNA-binding CsgD family transcriptional regulator/PAS domain-containing protein [Bradyrhizobium sp. USDA 4341]
MNAVSPDGLVLRAVEAIYDAAPDPTRWPHALGVIAECFSDAGAILLWHRDDGSYGSMVSESLVEAQRDYEESGWTRRDLAAARAMERGYFFNGEPFTNRHIVSREETQSDPFFVEFRAQHSLGPLGCVAVSPDPHVGVILSMQRHAGREEYSDDELEVLNRLGRHIEKSLRLSIRLLDAELVKLRLGEALSRIGIGVFALDSIGRVVFSNPAGEKLLGDQLQIVHERLHIGTGPTRETIDEAVSRALRGQPTALSDDPKPILVSSIGTNRRLVIYLLPVALSANLAEQFLTHTRAIILALEQRLDEPADPAVVRDVLGLTLGEARIAALVGSGLPPKEAAERLGITDATARTVLKRVFSKVGVSRQSELVAVLARLVLR